MTSVAWLHNASNDADYMVDVVVLFGIKYFQLAMFCY